MKNIFTIFSKLDLPMKNYILRHIACFVPMTISTVSTVVFPSFIHLIIDGNNLQHTMIYCAFMAVVGFMSVIAQYTSDVVYLKFSTDLYFNAKKSLFSRIIFSKGMKQKQFNTGELFVNLSNDINRIASFLTVQLSNGISNVLMLIGVSLYIVTYFKSFGLLVILFSAILVIVQQKLGIKIQELSCINRTALGNEASRTNEVLSSLEDIRMAGYAKRIWKNFVSLNNVLCGTAFSNDKMIYKSMAVSSAINMAVTITIIGAGILSVNNGSMEVGMLLSLLIYSQRIATPLKMLMSFYIETKNLRPVTDKLETVLDNDDVCVSSESSPCGELDSIRFENITFSYDDGDNILEYFNLSINKGEIIGLVGDNGRGKTTIIRLLMKLIKPQSGEIYINSDYSLSNINSDYMHDNISVITQSSFLLSGTLEEVINPLGMELDKQSIIEIMNRIGLNFDIFSQSFDYMISEKSLNVSGGEKQKIALVRMVVENKNFIIIDEVTASVDAASEKSICEFLKEYLQDKTAIIITHRPQLLSLCHRIIDLNS